MEHECCVREYVKVMDGAGYSMSVCNHRKGGLVIKSTNITYLSYVLQIFLSVRVFLRRRLAIGSSNYLNKSDMSGQSNVPANGQAILEYDEWSFPFGQTMTLPLLSRPVHQTVEAFDGAYRSVVA